MSNKCKLSDLCYLVTDNTPIESIDLSCYITTDNMFPQKGGIELAKSLPNVNKVRKFCKNDVLLSNIRLYFKKIWKAKFDGGCSNDVLVFRALEGTDEGYLYYLLSNDAFFDYAVKNSNGTKMPRGDKSAIMKYEVVYKDLQTQRKMASILSPIDEKIELNNRINKNLEQQAQAIFKYYFVDFEPFGGTMPNNWKLCTINDISKDIICGKTPSTKNKDYYGVDVPFITIPDMHNNVYITKTERYLSTLGAETQKQKFLPKNSVCVSCIGTAGLVSLTSSISQTNQQINSIIPKSAISAYYVYFTMKYLTNKIKNFGANGSVFSNLNKSQFSKIEIILPELRVIKSFNDIVEPMFDMILSNQQENENLIDIRDTLLTRLMSNEIEV